MRRLCACGLIILALASSPGSVRASGFDWEIEENPAGPTLSALRNARDGLVGLLDDAADLQLGLFAEVALLLGMGVMGASDMVGLIDDNPVSQYVLKGVASKSLAKTAYLLHLAGSEAVLGSHGLETTWAVEDAMTELNPLLDAEEAPTRLPLDPLSFVGEGLMHDEVYTAHLPGSIAAASLVTDGLLGPAADLLRAVSVAGPADRLDERGRDLIRWATGP